LEDGDQRQRFPQSVQPENLEIKHSVGVQQRRTGLRDCEGIPTPRLTKFFGQKAVAREYQTYQNLALAPGFLA